MRGRLAAKRAALRYERIFVDENLTKTLRQLLSSAKQHAGVNGYKFVWVKNGKVFVRQTSTGLLSVLKMTMVC